MSKQKIFLIFSLVILGSCQSNSQKVEITEGIIKIDISKNYPTIQKSEEDFISDTEYVPLETNRDILVNSDYAQIRYVSEKYIVIMVIGHGEVFIFTREGKIVTFLNRNGQGPEEYTSVREVVFDEKNEEIFVFDNVGIGRVLVYSLTGEYRRTLKYSIDINIVMRSACEFDEETMLVYDTGKLYDDTYNKKPYMFMSKRDGSLTPLDISLPVRYAIRAYEQFTDPSGQTYTFATPIPIFSRIMHYGQDFVIADISSDTIYRLTKNRDLTPFIVCKPSLHSMNSPLAYTISFITDKYIFLEVTTLDYVSLRKGLTPSVKVLLYEFDSGEITTIDNRFLYSDHINTLQKNIDARLFDVTRLKDAYEKNELDGELKQLVETLDEEDNPVVRIRKFK